ncbi:hypothetical protein EI94DRAFT_1772597 [Lactarius quietus]|nr:hypothetical protein EI94DRAFT_1772597 [Lactarius quietus]
MTEASKLHTFICHPSLSARPCSSDGTFLKDPILPPPQDVLEPSGNPWHPFGHRLEFEWAHYHYVRLQSSANDIQCGLDLWRAKVKRHQTDNDSCDKVPWKTTKELYDSIDSISAGAVGWTTYKLSYNGPQPAGTPPQWMEETYELNVRNVLSVFEDQLALKEFDSQFEYALYKEYDHNGTCVYSNLMSGNWAFREADMISQDKEQHGSMLIPIIAGSDKTTVSVATGHQEYHPVYASLGNITNTAHCGHGNGIVPVAFLSIPKRIFCCQLYHRCLELVFVPLKPYMTKQRVMKCPDGHFHCTIFSLGLYIADYLEQVWLTGIVSNWCLKCDALPSNLDDSESHQRSHAKTDVLLKTFSPHILWANFGIWHNIAPFTCFFPCTDIHELLAPDLLHQLIKGVFKDHLVEWVLLYLQMTHREKKFLEIIDLCCPPFSGLHWFPDGCDYQQWTGDNSKALMMVFLPAVAGYIPSMMVHSISAFMDAYTVETFHKLHDIFIDTGIHTMLSLPCQHALKHFYHSIHLFGSPIGLCSFITKSKHILSTKHTWQRSSRNHALSQMLRTLHHMDKMSALHQCLEGSGLLKGLLEPMYINQPRFPLVFSQFLYKHCHPEEQIAPPTIKECPAFEGTIKVHHSAVATYYSPSNFGLQREQIRSTSNFHGHPRQDTVFIVVDNSELGMEGMEVGHVLLLFSFEYQRKTFLCMLINWFVHADERDPDTGMWVVKPELDRCGKPTLEVIHLDSIARAAHLVPIYGQSWVPEDFNYHDALDIFNSFFVNHYINHHAHEFISRIY